ncbi:MAG: caspase family protein [Elusimicrobiota bacterium]
MKTPSIAFVLALSTASAAGPRGLQASPADGGIERLAVALIDSAASPETARYLGKGADKAEPSEHDAEMLDEVAALLQKKFRGVVTVKSFDEAAEAGADLIAVVAVESSVARTIFGKSRYEVLAVLLTPAKETVDSFRVSGSQRGRPPLTPSDIRERAAEKTLKALSEAVDGSSKLAKTAASLAREPKARRAQAPAPSTPSEPAYSSDVDAPDYSVKEEPGRFAMVVGIERYAGIPEARFAERDAAAVRAHLLALGYPERNIVYLTGQYASRAGLAKNLESWLPRNVTEDSTVFFYYSGHGAPDTKSGRAYLVPWDGDPRFLEDTAYPVERLYKRLDALKAARVIVALDACFSGGGGRSVLPTGARPLVMKVDPAQEAMGRLAVFAAAAADEITGAEESQGHGLFTYHFLKGLSGEAADGNGRVTARGLHEYLLPRVRDAARRENRDQTPALNGLRGRAEDILIR